jgi:predicted O-methyltransferase YrrM
MINQIYAQSSYMDRLSLYAMAAHVAHKGMRALEIGSWLGATTVVLADVASYHSGTVDCVDTWSGSGMEGDHLSTLASHGKDVIIEEFKRNMTDYGLINHISIFRGRTDDILQNMASNTYDIIFIDGCHQYDQVVRDIESCKHLVSPTGIICGHDYEKRGSSVSASHIKKSQDLSVERSIPHWGVILAVKECFGKNNVPVFPSKMWCAQKTDNRFVMRGMNWLFTNKMTNKVEYD